MKKYLIILFSLTILIGSYFIVQKIKATGVNNTTRGTNLNNRVIIPQFNGYSYERTITIANASSTQSNFPVLVCFNGISPCNASLTALKSTVNGGKVQSATGLDIIFTSDARGLNLLPYEQEFYASTTGESDYWVNISSVTNGTVFYMFYGNSGAIDRSNKTGTWNSNFLDVYHFPNGTTLSALDSTNSINGSITGTAATSSPIGGAGAYTAASDKISITVSSALSTAVLNQLSWSGWVFRGANDATARRIMDSNGSSSQGFSIQTPNGDFNVGVQHTTTGGSSVASAVITPGAWTYLAFTWNSANNFPTLYVNGVATSTSTTNKSGTQSAWSGVAALIGNRAGNDRVFNGKIDEMEFSSTVLSSSWIASQYNNQSSPSTFYTLGNETLNYGVRVIVPGN